MQGDLRSVVTVRSGDLRRTEDMTAWQAVLQNAFVLSNPASVRAFSNQADQDRGDQGETRAGAERGQRAECLIQRAKQ